MDLVTNGMRHCADLTRGRWDHENIEEMLSDTRRKAHFLQGVLRTKIQNSSIVGLAATEATPDDAWENLVQKIQETAGPYLHPGAPRPTRPLALERKTSVAGTWHSTTSDRAPQVIRVLRRMPKTEITQVEKQMRRFSRWPLEKTKGNVA